MPYGIPRGEYTAKHAPTGPGESKIGQKNRELNSPGFTPELFSF